MAKNKGDSRSQMISSPAAAVGVTLVFALTLMILLIGYLLLATEPETVVSTATPGARATALAAAPTSVPSLILAPSGGPPSSPIAVNGKGWPAGANVSLFLVDGSGEFESTILAIVPVDADGEFLVQLTPPPGVWERVKGFWVTAAGPGGRRASRFFSVQQPVATAVPTTAAATATPIPTATDVPTVPATAPVPTSTPPGTLVGTGTPSAPVTVPTSTAPAATPVPLPTATSNPEVVDTLWQGRYFANSNFAGAPAATSATKALLFDWGAGAPSGVTADRFSAQWTRSLPLPAGTYQFYLRAAAETRVWLDDILIFEAPPGTAAIIDSRGLGLPDGIYTFRVEFVDQAGGGAHLQFWWERLEDLDNSKRWQASYWSNRDLVGDPVFSRAEESIAYDWGSGRPDTRLESDNFSGQWRQTVSLPAGAYRFFAGYDDGVSVSVDGSRVIDDWVPGVRRQAEVELWLEAGPHLVEVAFFEASGEAFITFGWEASSLIVSGWRAEYFSGTDLIGPPHLLADAAAIEFNWGDGAPAAGMPVDNFSARWTKTETYEAGNYQLAVQVDDGARIYVDGVLVLDVWSAHVFGPTFSVEVELAGAHTIVVEYFDFTATAALRLTITRLS